MIEWHWPNDQISNKWVTRVTQHNEKVFAILLLDDVVTAVVVVVIQNVIKTKWIYWMNIEHIGLFSFHWTCVCVEIRLMLNVCSGFYQSIFNSGHLHSFYISQLYLRSTMMWSSVHSMNVCAKSVDRAANPHCPWGDVRATRNDRTSKPNS